MKNSDSGISCSQKHRCRATFRSLALVAVVLVYATHENVFGRRRRRRIRSVDCAGMCSKDEEGSIMTEETRPKNRLRPIGNLRAYSVHTRIDEEKLNTDRHKPSAYFSYYASLFSEVLEVETHEMEHPEWKKQQRQVRENDGEAAAEEEENEEELFKKESHVSTAQEKTAYKSCPDIPKAHPTWHIVWYILGTLYMFIALAIVCDEFFVPSLEEMSDTKHLNLSADVAGATLMAAGGSAPELFTSLFGTFRGSEVGFGTIVGSAVFNVLFVIACCAFLAKEVLQLTWWPLFRDCICYVIGLVTLGVFVGVSSPGRIELWEAVVLLLLYTGYVTIMYFNECLYKLITKKHLYAKDDDDDSLPVNEVRENSISVGSGAGDHLQDVSGSKNTVVSSNVASRESENDIIPSSRPTSRPAPLERGLGPRQASSSLRLGPDPWHGTFRAGVVKLLRDPESWTQTAGVGIVSQIEGDADMVFTKVDRNGDGVIDRKELEQLFKELDCHVPEKEMDDVMAELDVNQDGKINEEEFMKWYVLSEERILSNVKYLFDRFDDDKSGTINSVKIHSLLETIEPDITEVEVKSALDDMYQSGSRDEITYPEFADWYTHSIIYNQSKTELEEELGGVFEFVRPPKDGSIWDYVKWMFLLPILLVLTSTIPDVRIIHWGKFGKFKGKFCYLSFVVSIVWIGAFSYFMVNWTEIIGNTMGIPPVVMGYTFLAAGTSVPDMLSSVIVARRGEGDMAVSSSIGSNIFDILVGLPLPWILYTALPSFPNFIRIESDGLWISIFVLLIMVVLVILAIHCSKWSLTKPLGVAMFVLYAGFLVQAIWLEMPFETC